MKRSTLVLLGLVLVAAGIIAFWERKRPGTDETQAREGRLLPDLPEAEAFTRIERKGEAPVLLVGGKGAWALKAPVADAADAYAVEGFLERLRDARAVRFLDPPVAWGELGLDKPRASWTLTSGGGSTQVSLGSEAPLGEGVYCRVGERAALAPKDIEATLMKGADEFRSRDLVPPGSGRVVSFRVVRPGGQVLAASRSGEAWSLREPFSDAADGAKVEALLDEVTFARATAFLDGMTPEGAGLGSPRADISLTTDKGQTVVVRIGGDAPRGDTAAGDGGGGEVVASVSGRAFPLAVPSKVLAACDADPESLRSLDLFGRPSYEGEEILVEGGYSAHLRRDDGGAWELVGAAPGAKAAPLAEALTGLRASSAVGRSPDASAPAPFVTVTLKGKGFEEKALVGPERDGTRRAYPSGRSVELLLEGESWERAEAALKAIPLAPAKPKS